MSERERIDEGAAPAAEAGDDSFFQSLFDGNVHEVLPDEEIPEFHDFIRDEALLRRRFAVSFRVECRCLAWIGYSLANVTTHDEGIEFTARPTRTFVPDHEPDVEHPEGATEDPPEQFADWPIWPLEIYQDELEEEWGGEEEASDGEEAE